MKHYLLPLTFAVILFLCLAPGGKAADPVYHQTSEYATIRWSGRDNTHVIRPGGQVEFVGPQLAKVKKPDRVDDPSFYMNIVMNALAKEGYEFAGISNDEIIMKRAVHL
jgi:hypothetical protein